MISTDLSAAGYCLSIVAVAISVLESHAYVYRCVYKSVAQAFLLRPLYSALAQGFKSKHDFNVGLILSRLKKKNCRLQLHKKVNKTPFQQTLYQKLQHDSDQ